MKRYKISSGAIMALGFSVPIIVAVIITALPHSIACGTLSSGTPSLKGTIGAVTGLWAFLLITSGYYTLRPIEKRGPFRLIAALGLGIIFGLIFFIVPGAATLGQCFSI